MTHHKPIPLGPRVMLHTEGVICVVSFDALILTKT